LDVDLCDFIGDGVSFLVHDFSDGVCIPFYGDTATRTGALVACTVTFGTLELISGREVVVARDVDLY
jgi:hypothetical protein